MKFYISVAAVRQYMAIMDYRGSTDGDEFDRAAMELEQLADQARLAKQGTRRRWSCTNRGMKLYIDDAKKQRRYSGMLSIDRLTLHAPGEVELLIINDCGQEALCTVPIYMAGCSGARDRSRRADLAA